MKRSLTITIAAAAVALAGCGQGVVESTIASTIDRSSWTLRADGERGFVDALHVDFGRYPNPKQLPEMTVRVMSDGTLCASAAGKDWCGGPMQGIPYVTVLNVEPTQYCVRVVDIYGNDVSAGCNPGAPPATPRDDVSAPSTEPPSPDQASPSDSVAVGTSLVIKGINDGLAKIGLDVRVTAPKATKLVDFDRGDITLSQPSCKDVLKYLDSEFSDDHPGTDDYVFGPEAIAECLDRGRCRVGQLVTRAMAAACKQLSKDDNVHLYSATTGVVGGGGAAVQQLCDGDKSGTGIDKCVGSPLVIDLRGDGLQLKAIDKGARFAMVPGKPAMQVGWLAGSDDALLAIDLDGDGKITSAAELFGEMTGGWAPNGFVALARYDKDKDGKITPKDPVFSRLLAWRDNGDGVSQPGELVSLGSLGVRGISLRHRKGSGVDASGNDLGLVGDVTLAGGRTVNVVDVWFRMRTAPEATRAKAKALTR